jgi:hypothetical protein
VKDIDQVSANLDEVAGRKTESPRAFVVVASDRAHRCKLLERYQDRRVTDVATMNDEVRVVQRIERLRPNQTMGIGYQADKMRRRRPALSEHFQDRRPTLSMITIALADVAVERAEAESAKGYQSSPACERDPRVRRR